MARGQLRVYLGAAPGVGKTFKMLEEGRRRKQRGTDVVVGLVETHNRQLTESMLASLEVVPRRELTYRGSTFTEMDVDAVLARAPEVVLVDELAHTNIPGTAHPKRWQDIEQLLDAGITVLTTVNIQHLESLNDVVQEITGVPQRETVPDEVVRRAEQVELVDMTPEALRRRMVHGNVYTAERVDAALGNYFRVGNLTALRELALLWLADKVDDQLDRYRAEHNIQGTWETRERVVVALTGGPEGDTLIRRAARVAARSKGADLLAVHVANSDGLTGGDPANLSRQRVLVESLGGTYHQVVGADIPTALLDFARAVNATQLVLGASRRGRLAQLFSRGVGVSTTAESGSIDVHLVTHEAVRHGRQSIRLTRGLTVRRRLAGFAAAAILLALLTIVLDALRDDVSLTSDILLFLGVVIAVSLIGGVYPALAAAVVGFLLLNYFFTPPIHRFTVSEAQNLIALLVFLLVAVAVSTVVDLAARRTVEAARARAEAETLSTVAGSVLRGGRPLPALLEQVRETFGLSSVTLLERLADPSSAPESQRDGDGWQVAASVGGSPCLTPGEGDVDVPVDHDLSLVLCGRILAASDRRVVEAFAAQAALALRQERLGDQAAAAAELSETDRLRSAMLSAVSHELRTPLASAKAAVASLRSDDVTFSDADRAELLATAEESLDQLVRLVENLLDMSRLQAGTLGMHRQLISVVEAIPRAIDDIGEAGRDITVQAPDDIADVYADAGLLERILVNVILNAIRFSPPGEPPLVMVSEHAGLVEVRVIDRGPGIPPADRDRVFLPFRGPGDRDNQLGRGVSASEPRSFRAVLGGTELGRGVSASEPRSFRAVLGGTELGRGVSASEPRSFRAVLGGTELGVGLGLALSRGLAEAMGGTLHPESTPGGGLTIILVLPAAEEPDRPQPADEALLNRLDTLLHRPAEPGASQ